MFSIVAQIGRSWKRRTFERKTPATNDPRESFLSVTPSLQVMGSSFTTHASMRTENSHRQSLNSSNQVVIDVEHCESEEEILRKQFLTHESIQEVIHDSAGSSESEIFEKLEKFEKVKKGRESTKDPSFQDGYDYNQGFKFSERTSCSELATPNKLSVTSDNDANQKMFVENNKSLKHHNSLYVRKSQRAQNSLRNRHKKESSGENNDAGKDRRSSDNTLRRVRFSSMIQTDQDEENKRRFTKTPEIQQSRRCRNDVDLKSAPAYISGKLF